MYLVHRKMETRVEVENEIQGRWHASIRRGVVSRRKANAGLDINSLRSSSLFQTTRHQSYLQKVIFHHNSLS